MGLDSVVRSGVALANRLTQTPFQADVTHYPYQGTDGSGYGRPRDDHPGWARKALVMKTTRRVLGDNDREIQLTHRLVFLEQFAVDPRDEFQVAGDGRRRVGYLPGLLDKSKGQQQTYVTEVYLQ